MKEENKGKRKKLNMIESKSEKQISELDGARDLNPYVVGVCEAILPQGQVVTLPVE